MPPASLVAQGATVLLNMGQVLIDRGDQQDGVLRMEAALRVREAIAARSVAVASAHERLAWAYLASGRTDDAAVQARDAVGLEAELAPGSAPHATSLATAGSVQHAIGDFDEALRLQRQALTIHQAIQADSLGVGTDLNNIGLIYHDIGDLRRAARYYTRALACFEARAPRSPPRRRCTTISGWSCGRSGISKPPRTTSTPRSPSTGRPQPGRRRSPPTW